MMNRGYTGKQLRGAPKLTNREGVTPAKAKRQPTAEGGNTPAENVMGSRAGKGGVGGTKGAMSSSEGACAKPGGHIMGKG